MNAGSNASTPLSTTSRKTLVTLSKVKAPPPEITIVQVLTRQESLPGELFRFDM